VDLNFSSTFDNRKL